MRVFFSAFFLFFSFLAFSEEKQVVVEVISEKYPRVALIRNLLSDEDCDYLIKMAEPYLEPSLVVDADTGMPRPDPARTSFGMFFSRIINDSVIQNLQNKIANLVQIPVEHGEGFQVLRYEQGQEYKPHYDFFLQDSLTANGGNRYLSIIIYLNTPEEGGETVFPEINYKVKAEKGNAVAFFNMDEHGNLDYKTLHAGAPVIKGTKWIVTKWLRQGYYH